MGKKTHRLKDTMVDDKLWELINKWTSEFNISKSDLVRATLLEKLQEYEKDSKSGEFLVWGVRRLELNDKET